MQPRSKESASALAGLQSRLTQAELILNLLLDENISKEYVAALVTTYFSHIKTRENNNEKNYPDARSELFIFWC